MENFNIIKKSRKKSKDIDEKIEYLNKECQKTGLQEVMNTTGMYSVTKQEPNPSHVAFTGLSVNGQPLGFAGGDHTINAPLINGAIYSPPHPVTGERRAAGTWKGILIGFKAPVFPGQPIGSGSDRIPGSIMWVWEPNIPPNGRWVSLESNNGQWCVWVDNAFGSMSMVPYGSASSNLSNDLKNNLNNININNYTNPDDFGPPTNPVLFQNDLDDPSFLPINIDGISPQAFDYLKNKVASVNYDVYEKLWKEHGIDAANWYENNPDLPGSSNPHINPLIPLPLELAQNDSRYSEVVSDIDINPDLGAQPGDQLAFGGFGGGKPVDPNKKQNRATTQNIINHINSGGFMPLPKGWTKEQAQQFYNNYVNGTLSESLNEDVRLGHFEPEVLNVDINDIRKGIMPEFPKDPPPEMIGGYSAKSRLVRKDPKLPPYIKVTKKDLAKNHKLTDKEIQDFLDDVKKINKYIKKNPAQLIYAMTRYPKDDPRLAQLNFKMDEMKRASDQYVETHFPENVSLFNKLQNKIKQNIEMTNPDNFTGHAEAPKFIKTDISEQEKRRKTIIRHFKKKK